MSTVRIGVIGAGNMGADHVNTLHRWVSGAEVVSVADVDGERAASVAAVAGARATGDAHALIADPDVDAVVIASHDTTHADLAVAAVGAGKPVMCEKPLAPTTQDCVRVVREERRAGTGPISLGFIRRFDPAYVDLKAAVAEGTYGAPLLLRCVSRGVASAPGCTDEFSVTGSAIHEFDTVPWLLGSPVTEVSWHAPRTTSTVTGLRDPQLMLLRTADGGTPLAYTEPRTAHDALHFEAAETARCITTGQLQSPLRTLDESINTLRVMDDIRALCGIIFPPQ
ncbi:Gfo/Idh/MocA family protein [Streptomyces sp. NPDC001307]|uniref:Gfo/Idh/MocA family protein n=1 Tax=Streptomyces sp. NPDC001307 TaxID=3364560 RepID=UPI00367D4DA4